MTQAQELLDDGSIKRPLASLDLKVYIDSLTMLDREQATHVLMAREMV